ncbi:MAG: hypothetical protein IJR34_06165 [Bacteroidales bacterium]|nr:hypothetical protein [Bacteroidales bacterium]MBQ9597817.1 hypothetical protein [Bacteroidales bacterium]
MKKTLSFLCLALTLFACKKEEQTNDRTGFSYRFEANLSTKATLGENCVEWENGDQIGSFAGGLNNHAGDIHLGNPCTFDVATVTPLTPGDKVYAYAPYDENAGTKASELTLTIPVTQQVEKIAMPLAGVPYTVTRELAGNTTTPVDGMYFCNMAAIAKLAIYSNGTVAAGEKIQTIYVTSSADICGTFRTDLTAINPDDESSMALVPRVCAKTVSIYPATPVAIASSETEATLIPVVLAPGTYPLTVSVVTDKATYTKTTSESLTFARSHFKKLILDISSAVSIGVEPAGIRSFAKGATLHYALSLNGVEGVSVTACPDGWSTNISGNTLSVTAPATDTKALEGTITLSANGISKDLSVRLAGINSKEEFFAFADAMGREAAAHTAATADAEAYAAALAPYKADGWVCLNCDFTLTQDDFYSNYYAYVLHHIYEPINGNGHTITFDVTAKNTAGLLAFCQYIDQPVKNLNFAGRIVAGKTDANVSVLGISICNGATLDNIHSSVDIEINKPGNHVSGVFGSVYDATETLIQNCSYSGTTRINAPIQYFGGISAMNASGKGANRVTIRNCNYSGQFIYALDNHHNQVRIGGIIGAQERNGVVENCTNSGTMVFDIKGVDIATGNLCGIGGIMGRCNAIASGYTMYTKVSDCTFTGSIRLTNVPPTQPRTYINKIVGTPLSGYDSAASTGNNESGTISYESPETEISFTSTESVTFAYGETKAIAITTDAGVTEVSVDAQTGWTFDCSGWSEGSISVTAPANGQGSNVGACEIRLKGLDASGTRIVGTNAKPLRLYGINNADELAAFTAVYGNKTDTPVTEGEALAPYLSNGEITLNADITIPSGSVAWGAYWLKRLMLPLNGNGHTLTISTQQAERGGLFQNVGKNVHDLNISGTIECTGSESQYYIKAGSLASFISADRVTIKNVHSNATIKVNNNTEGNVIYVGGLVSTVNSTISQPQTVTFEDCSFTGTITTTKSVEAVGGILGAGGAGAQITFRNCSGNATMSCTGRGVKGVGGIAGGSGTNTNPGEILYFTDCSFTGTINYVSDGNYDTRIGGILGNLERGAQMNGCSFTGTINANMKRKAYFAGTSRGIGGLVGKDTAPDSGYPNMNAQCILTDCVSAGTIALTNVGDTEEDILSHVRQLVGFQYNYTETHIETNCTANSTITY